MLQHDLQKAIEQIQSRLSDRPGNQSLQMQLLGQQMLLCEHLKETQHGVLLTEVTETSGTPPFGSKHQRTDYIYDGQVTPLSEYQRRDYMLDRQAFPMQNMKAVVDLLTIQSVHGTIVHHVVHS